VAALADRQKTEYSKQDKGERPDVAFFFPWPSSKRK